ncbi:hypothetical protein E2C01_068847 [Portunus trituberculatus]|uniref:Uncharacterized protein n=1 Tax=Portunus trituberculatus TaxID=210409 RepID=A0A5B7HZ00_PORTR|nr:hypothetical protein [Portunus trituberculatus]
MCYRLPNFVSPFPDTMAIATDALVFQRDFMEVYTFPPFYVIIKVLNKLHRSKRVKLIVVASFMPQKEWFLDLVELGIDTPRRLPTSRTFCINLKAFSPFSECQPTLPTLNMLPINMS